MHFKDATFGVPAGAAESTQSPEPGLTIVRDEQFGVPHIYGDTRAEPLIEWVNRPTFQQADEIQGHAGG